MARAGARRSGWAPPPPAVKPRTPTACLLPAPSTPAHLVVLHQQLNHGGLQLGLVIGLDEQLREALGPKQRVVQLLLQEPPQPGPVLRARQLLDAGVHHAWLVALLEPPLLGAAKGGNACVACRRGSNWKPKGGAAPMCPLHLLFFWHNNSRGEPHLLGAVALRGLGDDGARLARRRHRLRLGHLEELAPVDLQGGVQGK